eukprot:Blabericola_migrator_1__12127@NODE_748_length_6661_cov_222_679102_g536_i0_p2_GENE_NODE_748_length_6661_cov_222_679102_g536_i0NODE_748_length_6661_cov_222_679102_g536_i0_p2_ORF_typecomplete_len447_score66_52_NODE_748_length_6661_cov_222_679102_g536_i015652905
MPTFESLTAMAASLTEILSGPLLSNFLGYLTPEERCILLGLNKAVRSRMLSPLIEFQHMRECMIITSACWTPELHSAIGGAAIISPKTWLHFLVILHQEMEYHSSTPELEYQNWRWKRRADPILDRLTHQWRCLCPAYLEGCRDSRDDLYIEDLAVYDMVEGDVMTLIKAAQSIDFNEFVEALVPEVLWLEYYGIDEPVTTFMRIIRVQEEFQPVLTWHALEEEAKNLGRHEYEVEHKDSSLRSESGELYGGASALFLAPFLVRVLMAQEGIVERFVSVKPLDFHSTLRSFRPWDSSTHNILGFDSWELLKIHSSVFNLAPDNFWDLSIPLKLDPKANLEQWSEDDVVLCEGLRAMQPLEAHIIDKVKAHARIQAKGLFDLTKTQFPVALPEDGEGDLGILEISLTEAYTGPNSRVNRNDCQGNVCMLNLGPSALFLYRRHNEHGL